jgi:hypothetical protein
MGTVAREWNFLSQPSPWARREAKVRVGIISPVLGEASIKIQQPGFRKLLKSWIRAPCASLGSTHILTICLFTCGSLVAWGTPGKSFPEFSDQDQ